MHLYRNYWVHHVHHVHIAAGLNTNECMVIMTVTILHNYAII